MCYRVQYLLFKNVELFTLERVWWCILHAYELLRISFLTSRKLIKMDVSPLALLYVYVLVFVIRNGTNILCGRSLPKGTFYTYEYA